MKISNEEATKLNTYTAAQNPFSRVECHEPDSPPPKLEESSDEEERAGAGKPPKPNKFERLMKAACSIKTYELDQRKKKFENLPAFLKAGVYYTTKLESVR
jgi:hypothetical protein